jgi:soluble lytic murein transglycosylase-like protein
MQAPSIQAPSIQAPKQTTKYAYIAIARSDANEVGINADYFVQQMQLESNFNPNAQSAAGATGIAQFMPETARGLGIDPTDPVASLRAAAHLMANLMHRFGNNYAKALAAYNLGSERVANAEQVSGTNWLSQLPAYTQNYIREIMN